MDSDRKEEEYKSTKIQELKAVIRDQNNTITRLRASRDLHRTKNKDLIATNHDLKERIRALTIKEEIANLNSNTKKQPKYLTKTPIPIFTSSAASENNKKYPDVPNYYNDKDK